jgi:hypothetical protein
MGTACNVLTAIGGTPRLNTADFVPTYPGPLPGGVHTDLIVLLSGLTNDVVKSTFMEIELPESGPVAFTRGMAFPTIGAFYDAIFQAFQQIDPPPSLVSANLTPASRTGRHDDDHDRRRRGERDRANQGAGRGHRPITRRRPTPRATARQPRPPRPATSRAAAIDPTTSDAAARGRSPQRMMTPQRGRPCRRTRARHLQQPSTAQTSPSNVARRKKRCWNFGRVGQLQLPAPIQLSAFSNEVHDERSYST